MVKALLMLFALAAVAWGQLQDILAEGEYLLEKQKNSLLAEVNNARGDRGACPVKWDDTLVEDVRSTFVHVKSNGVAECRYWTDPNFAETTYSQYVHTGLDDSITWLATDVISEWTNPLNWDLGNVTLWKSITRIGCGQCRLGDRGTAGSGYMVWMICRWEHKTGEMSDNIGQPGEKCDLCEGVTCSAVDGCHEDGVCDALTGQCSTPTKPNGTPCDDNNAATVEDKCTAGKCQGVDKCAGTVCSADQCHVAGTCDPMTGQCSAPTPKQDGTPCNDGNGATVDDVCTAGTCQGTVAGPTEPQVVMGGKKVTEEPARETMDGWETGKGRVGLRKVPFAGSKAHFPDQSAELPSGTELRVECPAGKRCEVFVAVFQCPPCQSANGGLPGMLMGAGWEARSCAPQFEVAGGWARMVAFRKVVTGEETFVTDRGLRHFAIFTAEEAVGCEGRDTAQCTSDARCLWKDTECIRNWCPRSLKPVSSPPKPPSCPCP